MTTRLCDRVMAPRVKFDSPDQVAEANMDMRELDREHFRVAVIDCKNRQIVTETIAVGTKAVLTRMENTDEQLGLINRTLEYIAEIRRLREISTANTAPCSRYGANDWTHGCAICGQAAR